MPLPLRRVLWLAALACGGTAPGQESFRSETLSIKRTDPLPAGALLEPLNEQVVAPVGAFALDAASRDAVLPANSYTVQASGAGDNSGVA